MDILTSFRRSKPKQLQTPDLEIDFLVDSGAESNIKNIPTWNSWTKSTSTIVTLQNNK